MSSVCVDARVSTFMVICVLAYVSKSICIHAWWHRLLVEFNTDKCEVIPTAGHHSQLDRSLFPPSTVFREDGNFELLGGPIGTADHCNAHTQERVDKAAKVLEALGELPDPQVALLLLRHCASFGKLVYPG